MHLAPIIELRLGNLIKRTPIDLTDGHYFNIVARVQLGKLVPHGLSILYNIKDFIELTSTVKSEVVLSHIYHHIRDDLGT